MSAEADAREAGSQEPDGKERDSKEASGPLAMRFRIFKRGTWRRAFRLEEAFWTVLERAAKDRGYKISDYIKALVDQAPGNEANQSSMLRVHAVEWLGARLSILQGAQDPREVLHAALAVPLPCFVIGANRSLVNYNSEFTAYVTGRAQEAASDEDVSKARLSLDVPIDRLIEVLSAQQGRSVLCGFTIRTSLAIATGRAKVTLAQPSRRDMVVGYILPGSAG